MTSKFPADLLEDLRKDRILPVVGYGYPDFAEKRLSETEDPVEAIQNWIGLFGPHVWPLFHAIAHLPVNHIISLTPDPWLSRILETYDQTWLELGLQQPDYPSGRRLILPLAGSLNSPQSVSYPATTDSAISPDREILWALAESFAARSRLLVMGLDPANERTLRLLARLQPIPPTQKRGWLLSGTVGDREREVWEARGFEIIEAVPAEILRQIGQAGDTHISAEPRRRSIVKRPTPYKYLDYFARDDSAIFFGRSFETQKLCDLVFSHRLVVVTGASGCGKTSLLNAGLLANTDGVLGYAGVYARVEDDPVASIRRSVATAFSVKQLLKDTSLSFVDFLGEARNRRDIAPVIVLDQSEELFTRIGQDLRDELFLTIRACLTASRLSARFVLSLRDDYLPRLAEVRNDLPAVLNNVFYVNDLGRDAATEAICLPAENMGVSFNIKLAERILDEIGLSTFSPPQLQIICTQLFQERMSASIDEDLYEKLGGARDILRHFLASELARLGNNAKDARQILKAMVTTEGTKDLLTANTIARRADLSESRVEKLLMHLRDHSRLLRGVQLKDGNRFELSHEYLTKEIWSWMTEADLKRREVEDLMDRELRSWRRFKHLRLGLDRLQSFENSAQFVGADLDALTILLLSSIKHKGHAEVWIERIAKLDLATQDRIAEQLFDYFHHRDRLQRRDAAEAIAALNPNCLLRALSNGSEFQRNAAIEMLGGIELRDAAEPLSRSFDNSDRHGRILICGALGEIQGEVAIQTLTRISKDRDTLLAAAAIRAAGRIVAPGATAIIQTALASSVSGLVKAGQVALAQARSSLHFKNLLNDELVSPKVRQIIWSAVKEHPEALIPKVRSVLNSLSDRGLQEASQNPDSNIKYDALNCLVARGGKAADEAFKRLSTEFRRNDSEARRAESKVGKLLTNDADLNQLHKVLSDQYLWLAAVERLADTKYGLARLIDRFASSGEPMLRIEAFRAVYKSKETLQMSERVIIAGLTDPDPTVRYFGCLAASRQSFTGLADALSFLIDDSAIADEFLSEHNFLGGVLSKLGSSVSDAAQHALDRLHPSSKVWRKPFQETFKK